MLELNALEAASGEPATAALAPAASAGKVVGAAVLEPGAVAGSGASGALAPAGSGAIDIGWSEGFTSDGPRQGDLSQIVLPKTTADSTRLMRLIINFAGLIRRSHWRRPTANRVPRFPASRLAVGCMLPARDRPPRPIPCLAIRRDSRLAVAETRTTKACGADLASLHIEQFRTPTSPRRIRHRTILASIAFHGRHTRQMSRE